MFIHDIVKIRLSSLGYLPNYPYHLISDIEMCDAFLPYEYDSADPYAGYDACMDAPINFFRDYYPLIDESLLEPYKKLVSEIAWHLNQLKQANDTYILPNWVYSYMLNAVLSVNSSQLDLHDLFVLLGTDNLYDEFTVECADACYAESVNWINKLLPAKKIHRPPTMFGEPHVIKSLRLKAANLTDIEYNSHVNEG